MHHLQRVPPRYYHPQRVTPHNGDHLLVDFTHIPEWRTVWLVPPPPSYLTFYLPTPHKQLHLIPTYSGFWQKQGSSKELPAFSWPNPSKYSPTLNNFAQNWLSNNIQHGACSTGDAATWTGHCPYPASLRHVTIYHRTRQKQHSIIAQLITTYCWKLLDNPTSWRDRESAIIKDFYNTCLYCYNIVHHYVAHADRSCLTSHPPSCKFWVWVGTHSMKFFGAYYQN